MARIRTIKPRFWDDVKIGKIPRDVRLMYIGMWNFADDHGVIIGDPTWLKSKLFPYDNIQIQQMERWLSTLVDFGFISLLPWKGERFFYLPNFARHQVINRPNLDDVNIPGDALASILGQTTDASLTDHGTITDASPPERKGNGKERENTACAGEERVSSKRFTRPTAEEVGVYCAERGNGIDPEQFVDHYTSNGWLVGRNPMKDWRAAVRSWEKSRANEQGEDRIKTLNNYIDA